MCFGFHMTLLQIWFGLTKAIHLFLTSLDFYVVLNPYGNKSLPHNSQSVKRIILWLVFEIQCKLDLRHSSFYYTCRHSKQFCHSGDFESTFNQKLELTFCNYITWCSTCRSVIPWSMVTFIGYKKRKERQN